MRILLLLIEKEFKQIFRDRFLPRILFALPVLQLMILPFAANFEMTNINIGVIDNDGSTTALSLRNKISASNYFNLVEVVHSYHKGLKAIEEGDVDVLLEIPPHFEKDLLTQAATSVCISANAVDGMRGGLASSYLRQIIQDYNVELLKNNTIRIEEKAMTVPTITNRFLYNPHLDYRIYMVPGIMAFLMTLVGVFIASLNIVKEKEKGTIEQINVSPLPKWLFLLSKLIPFWICGFVLLTFGFLIAWLFYGLLPEGSFLLIYLFVGVYLIATTGLGLTISNISSTQQQAMFTAFFFMIVALLLSGLFTPISSMPFWVQQLDYLNPVRYMVEIMRLIYLNGSVWSDLKYYFIIIVAFAVVFNIMAIITYRKNNK